MNLTYVHTNTHHKNSQVCSHSCFSLFRYNLFLYLFLFLEKIKLPSNECSQNSTSKKQQPFIFLPVPRGHFFTCSYRIWMYLYVYIYMNRFFVFGRMTYDATFSMHSTITTTEAAATTILTLIKKKENRWLHISHSFP